MLLSNDLGKIKSIGVVIVCDDIAIGVDAAAVVIDFFVIVIR